MKVIFTNGCFDILHYGHVKLLEFCKSYGHVIVGLNSDASISKLKGTSRPINSESDRKYVLESLKFVDEVYIFDEDTPYELISRINPDIIIKGGDYTPDTVVGSDIADVKIFEYIDGVSTTSVIEKLQL
jgi:D-beta-D-heptose 7-phosphate kinase/D-beta-D-heptose 1-phosphate adenosyltransferase